MSKFSEGGTATLILWLVVLLFFLAMFLEIRA